MFSFYFISLFIYSCFGFLICLGYYFQKRKEEVILNLDEKKIDLNELVVIIPFRNEEFRLLPLVNDINRQKVLPNKFLFIDDHSTDNSEKVIRLLNDSISFEILKLPVGIEGKKAAIRYGINYQKCNFNLTWDADIQIQPTYFEFIQTLPKKDLYVLPVIMKGSNFLEYYFESDHALANAINTSISGWKRPFLASGANLLFNQESFLEVDDFESHAHISSGDDMFLLRDFRIQNRSIDLISNSNYAVTTRSPKTLKEFFQQRLRWIRNGKEVNDLLSSSLILLTIVFNSFFICYFIFLGIEEKWKLFFFLLGLKSIVELIVYATYFFKIKRYITWAFNPLYSFFQPIYIFILIFLLVFYQPKWKNRPIYIKL